MKRLFDLFFGLALSLVLMLPMVLIGFLIKLTSNGPVIHWSNRVGIDNKIFKMPKFRSMKIETPNVATHKLKNPNEFYSPIGSFLRSSSLDELPQLFSIIKGDMSFVGPRPALFNQNDLINLRSEKGIHKLKPGVTGWAQINGRDNLSIQEKVNLDNEYKSNQSISLDVKIILMSIIKVFKQDNVSH